jgi:hypothetical protein
VVYAKKRQKALHKSLHDKKVRKTFVKHFWFACFVTVWTYGRSHDGQFCLYAYILLQFFQPKSTLAVQLTLLLICMLADDLALWQQAGCECKR